jgi:aspartate carbamoyltransferase catalytic subunit
MADPTDTAPLRHLLTLEHLSRATLETLLSRAAALRPQALGHGARDALRGRTVVNLFFEPSTRTRSSFQLAALRLGADVLNFEVALSSTRKGESAVDTLRNLEAMGASLFVVRHSDSLAVTELAAHAAATSAVVNAGDGRNAHPTQGLLDMLTIRQHKGEDFSGLRVAIVGERATRAWRAPTCTRCAPWVPARSGWRRRRRCCPTPQSCRARASASGWKRRSRTPTW